MFAVAVVGILGTAGGCCAPGVGVTRSPSIVVASSVPARPARTAPLPVVPAPAGDAVVPPHQPSAGAVSGPARVVKAASTAPSPSTVPASTRRTAAASAAPAPRPPVPPVTAVDPNAFAFTLTNADGTPVRWNPCAPIHYVTNLTEAPASAAGDVGRALQLLTEATGLSFVNDGSTSERPSAHRPVYQPSRNGSAHPPLLIAWARRSETDIYNGEGPNTVGTASNSWVGAAPGAATQESAYVTGQVAIETDATHSFPAGFGAGRTIGLTLLHELGHIAGLAHVQDPNQVMNPDLVSVPTATYAAGDRNGLRRVGASVGCLPSR